MGLDSSEIILVLVIGITALISWYAWKDRDLLFKYQFNAYQIVHRKQWYRIFTHAFLHANWSHLIINMIVLYSFGVSVINIFSLHPVFSGAPVLHFVLLYFGAIVFSSLYSLIKHKDDPHYNAIGASGAVSAVVFTSIFFLPWHLIYFFGIIPVPGIVFGIIYMIYSYKMSQKGGDNIGHDAHLWGAIFGFVYPLLIEPSLIINFFNNLLAFNFG